MAKDNLKEKKVLVVDNGLFCELAIKLSESFDRVYYFTPWANAFPKINNAIIGGGFDEITRISNIWDRGDDYNFNDIDLFVFPDVYDGALQLQLQSMGKNVWGSRKGEDLELKRWETKKLFKEIGLPVAKTVRIIGTDTLREFLMDPANENKWIKISSYRGSFETWHHDTFQLSEPILDEIEYKLGKAKDIIEFIVEDAIDNSIEAGYDGFCIDGKFPSIAICGYEIKDMSYVGMFKDYDKFPEGVRIVNDKLSEILKGYNYRGFYSTEIRIDKSKTPYYIDPCSRCGSPPNELYQEMISNLGEIMWYGAQGILVDPIPEAKFGVEVLIHSDWANNNWQAIHFPNEIRQWVKLRNATKIDGNYYIVPQDCSLPEIGAVVAIGNTLEEAMEKVKGYCKQVTGHRIDCKVDSLETAMEVIEQGEKDLGVIFK